MQRSIALVTGASSGIGKDTALELSNSGFIVYAAARRVNLMQDLAEKGIQPIALDVTDEESILQCVSKITEEQGRIDILVNAAGYGCFGAIEDVPLDEARRQFEVNLFGLARLIQLVVPEMRKNRYGKIVNISSMAGKVWMPFGGWYHATKFALEGFSDSLRLELKPMGIDVIIIEPGGIKTDWGIIAADNLKNVSANGAYAKTAGIVSDSMAKLYSSAHLSSPKLIAQVIRKAVTARKPKTRYLVGFIAKPLVFAKAIIGDTAYDRLLGLANKGIQRKGAMPRE